MNRKSWLPVTPNQLTALRILAAPVLIVLLFLDRPVLNLVGLGVFFLAAMTDYWDGLLARRWGAVSRLGNLLDPIADKILITTCLVMLVSMGHAEVIPTIAILAREFAVSGLRQVAAAEGIPIDVVRGAKWKTTFQMLAIGPLLVHHDYYNVPVLLIGQILLWVAAAITLITGAGYFLSYYRAESTENSE